MKIFRDFAAILTITVILVIVMEAAARLAVKHYKWNPDYYMFKYSDDDLKNIYNTDDPAFYREVLGEGWGQGVSVAYEPFVEFLSSPFQGKHVTVANQGFRTWPGGPSSLDDRGPKVFVFGGSTGFGLGVSGAETIAYYLQRRLREAGLDDALVFNFSVVGHYSTQERIYFERLLNQGQVPAAAVFMDGHNEFVFCDFPDRSGQSEKIEKLFKGPSRVTFLQTLKQRSNVVKLFEHLSGEQKIDARDGAHCKGGRDEALPIIRRLNSNRRIIAAIARDHGVIPVFVQQPVMAFAYDKSRFPARVNGLAPDVGVHPGVASGYPLMEELKAKGEMFDHNVLWLEKAEIGQSQYIDGVHYSPQFHDYLAQRIGDFLAPRMKEQNRN